MENFIAILLVVIAYELYSVHNELRHGNDLLQRISLGLFPIPNGGLDQLVYLQHIYDKLKELVGNKD